MNERVTFCVRNAINKVDQRERSVKSMKRMHSEEEIRAYLNQAEPITDAEVERFYERLKPKLLREIEKMPAKKPCRRKIGKISAIAAAILLMALATAQALGLNVIGGIMSLTKEHLVMDIDDAALPRSGRTAFSDAERETWGEEVCAVFEAYGYFPMLPQWRPEGMVLKELVVYGVDEEIEGPVSVNALFTDSNGIVLSLYADEIPEGASFRSYVERDENFEKTYYIGDTPVYVVSNGKRWSATWMSDGMCIHMSEGVSLEAMERMVNSMRE